jgi:thiamine-phosphate diphosphorylase
MARLGPRDLDLTVITTGTLVRDRSHEQIATAAVEGGATAVQLRAPELDEERLLPLALTIRRICGEGVLFLVNDRVDVAVASGAAGAHVGQGDEPERARGRLGPDRILGVSVTTPEETRAAESAGADYLGVTIWATATKPEAVPVGLEGLRSVVASTSLPVVGVGGIDVSNAGAVIQAGAAGVAVIGAVATAPDPVEAVRRLRAAVDDARAARGAEGRAGGGPRG